MALIHQRRHQDGEQVERIALGILNDQRGEVEALDVDEGNWGSAR